MFFSKLNLCLFFIISIYFVHGDSNDDSPLTKLGSSTGPTIKFYYCYSCGYKRVFNDYQSLLAKKYPEIQIIGENYNPPGYNMFIAKSLNVLKVLVIILILTKFNVFQWMGHADPFWWQWFTENRLFSCIFLFFAGNAIEGYLISSGAFEIYFNDVPVWSKLETGKIPLPPQLIEIIDNHLQMIYPNMVDAAKSNYYV